MGALAGFIIGLAPAFGSAQVCPNGCCKDAHGPHCPAHPLTSQRHK
jgi:hypothetical protein